MNTIQETAEMILAHNIWAASQVLSDSSKLEKAAELVRGGKVHGSNGHWTVESSQGEQDYALTPHCSCASRQYHGTACKHEMAVALAVRTLDGLQTAYMASLDHENGIVWRSTVKSEAGQYLFMPWDSAVAVPVSLQRVAVGWAI